MVRKEYLNPQVPLPPGLNASDIGRAIDYMEAQLAELVEVYFEQANVFSAIVGIYGIRALDSFSVYEKNRHKDLAQQRFPDLKRRGGSNPPPPLLSLESKASKRPWELQSHFDHPGWYLVWRYLVDEIESFEPGRPVIIWRVDIVYLEKEDWKYEGSTASTHGGGRTHTFGLRQAAKKLHGKAVYSRADVALRSGKPIHKNGS